MIETLLTLGILSVLIFIASKLEIINHNTDRMLSLIIGWGKNPPPPPPSYDAKKHSECYPMM